MNRLSGWRLRLGATPAWRVRALTTASTAADCRPADAEAPRAVHRASAFTGKPDFYESLFFLQDVLKRAQSVSARGNSQPAEPARVPWHSQTQMADRIGFSLSKLQYRQVRALLNGLAAHIKVAEVRALLAVFSPANLDDLAGAPASEREALIAKYSNREPDLGCIDRLGRAVSVGRRKAASAKVALVPGTGECYVNGRPAIEYFKRPHEMCRIADPLGLTGSFAKYNAWCLVRGGGLSGQAGAIAHGLAKAIALLEPKHKSSLEQSTPHAPLAPSHPVLPRRPPAPRPALRRAEEAWPAQGPQKVHLGQALGVPINIVYPHR